MTVKNMQASTSETRKFLFCLFLVSIFLLLSGIFLLKSSDSFIVPESVLMLMLINSTRDKSPIRSNNLESFSNHPSVTSSSGILHTEVPVWEPHLNTYQGGPVSNSVTRAVEQGKSISCNSEHALLKVFMYDLPSEFHFGLLGWNGQNGKNWPDVTNLHSIPAYPGGLNIQHSIAYWLTLDLLSSEVPDVVRPCTATRVRNSSYADIVFVPFFSSVSYNRFSKIQGKEKVSKNRKLQDQLVEFLMDREEWKRTGGRDHLIVAHHPNSMLHARMRLGSAMFVLADFGRYPVEIANIDKDIIAPYKHVVHSVGNDSTPFEDRPTLAFFQGAIYRKAGGFIRQELYYLLKDEVDVHFTFGTAQRGGVTNAGQGMSSSKFCLNVAGDTPSSNRLFDAIASHCVPVIISDEIELPFEDILDYSEFCIFVRGADAVKPGFLMNLLRGIKREEWTRMWKRLKDVAHHFEFKYPSQPGDAVDMTWEAVAHKITYIQLKLHRENRFRRQHVTKI
ncbi:probable arabinosyltransferase ARAD1 [Aristolochia californica]|uniref:probable arabinosyltransferase ARAD1 n=1 Tax=Aristolochia californica TaxID=171875 RepID=UPI0035E08D78